MSSSPGNLREPGKGVLIVQESGQEALVSGLVTGDDHARIWNGIKAFSLNVSAGRRGARGALPDEPFAVALMNAGDANEAEIRRRIHDIRPAARPSRDDRKAIGVSSLTTAPSFARVLRSPLTRHGCNEELAQGRPDPRPPRRGPPPRAAARQGSRPACMSISEVRQGCLHVYFRVRSAGGAGRTLSSLATTRSARIPTEASEE